MIVLHSVSLVALAAMLIYVICFFCKYRFIPQSLSVTAEWSGRYRWWQVTICTVMGWLSYYLPTCYPFAIYGALPLLGAAGVAGLALAGYYSYSPEVETKRDLTIHKIGSFVGAVLLCLFYLLVYHNYFILTILGVGVILGLLIPGYRYGYSKSNSIIFWEELGIIGIVGYYIIINFIGAL